MKYRTFPGTDLSISEIGFGTWTLSTGWWGEKIDDEVVAMLRSAHDDFGITFFDAAGIARVPGSSTDCRKSGRLTFSRRR